MGALVKEAPQEEDLGISSLVPHSAKSDFPYSTDPLAFQVPERVCIGVVTERAEF